MVICVATMSMQCVFDGNLFGEYVKKKMDMNFASILLLIIIFKI